VHRVRRLDLDRIQINNAVKWDQSKVEKVADFETLNQKGPLSPSMQSNVNMTYQIAPASEFETEVEKDILTIYEDVKVYDYAYKAFHKLRHEDGITKEMII